MMGSKFKVGDRVRCVSDEGSSRYNVGQEYVVESVVDYKCGDTLVKCEGVDASMWPHRFELVDPVWVPKVGDRVRIASARLTHKAEYIGKEFVIARETYKIGDETTWAGDNSHGYVWFASELEPATLTIEAGRYYTTRDGRKVGPMEVLSESGGTFYEVVGDGRLWSGEGTGGNLAEGEDLIALWPEPAATTAPVSAQVANDNDRLSITIDTSQTSAALDEIIKKLKKIRRLSAELGIDLAA